MREEYIERKRGRKRKRERKKEREKEGVGERGSWRRREID